MVKTKSESETIRHRKKRIVLWILYPLLLIPNIIASYFYSENTGFLAISGILVFFALIDLIIIFSISRKYYNWPSVLLLIFIFEMIMSWFHLPLPPGNVPFIIGIISILCSIRIIKSFDNNSFIRWFGFFSNIIIGIFMVGFWLLTSIMPGNISNFFIYSGSLLFIISILGIVFTLPTSNYIGWSANDRKIFFRMIIIPMVFVFSMICLIFVFNDTFRILMNSYYTSVPWDTGEIRLFNLEGIPQL